MQMTYSYRIVSGRGLPSIRAFFEVSGILANESLVLQSHQIPLHDIHFWLQFRNPQSVPFPLSIFVCLTRPFVIVGASNSEIPETIMSVAKRLSNAY